MFESDPPSLPPFHPSSTAEKTPSGWIYPSSVYTHLKPVSVCYVTCVDTQLFLNSESPRQAENDVES